MTKMPDTLKYIGCCGAHCRTCQPFTEGFCKGCKLGYDDGTRFIDKARCRMKICCFKERKFETCADCSDFDSCSIIAGFFPKKDLNIKNTGSLLSSSEKTGIPDSSNLLRRGKDSMVKWINFSL
jgi:hypothetical protein